MVGQVSLNTGMQTDDAYREVLAEAIKLDTEWDETKVQVAQLSINEMRDETHRPYAFLQTRGEPYARVAGLLMDLAVLQPGDLGMCASPDEQVNRAVMRLLVIYGRMRKLGERIRP